MMEPLSSHSPVVLATPAQAFFHLVLSPGRNAHTLTFSVKDEVNVRYYLIEGSHDLLSFDRITRIYAKGNCALPCSYSATIRDTGYRYYRVRQVDNASASVLSPDEVCEPSICFENAVAQHCTAPGGTHIHGAFF